MKRYVAIDRAREPINHATTSFTLMNVNNRKDTVVMHPNDIVNSIKKGEFAVDNVTLTKCDKIQAVVSVWDMRQRIIMALRQMKCNPRLDTIKFYDELGALTFAFKDSKLIMRRVTVTGGCNTVNGGLLPSISITIGNWKTIAFGLDLMKLVNIKYWVQVLTTTEPLE